MWRKFSRVINVSLGGTTLFFTHSPPRIERRGVNYKIIRVEYVFTLDMLISVPLFISNTLMEMLIPNNSKCSIILACVADSFMFVELLWKTIISAQYNSKFEAKFIILLTVICYHLHAYF